MNPVLAGAPITQLSEEETLFRDTVRSLPATKLRRWCGAWTKSSTWTRAAGASSLSWD
jgi:hypothetical protein